MWPSWRPLVRVVMVSGRRQARGNTSTIGR